MVKILALQAACAAASNPIIKTANHIFTAPINCANITGAAQAAYSSIAILRERITDQPFFISLLDR